MDWYSWLSKTNLEPSLTYQYGLAFTHNELQKEDLVYFNHEFLLSLGITVAKHRLEILKLVRKELGKTLNGFSKLVLTFTKTKKFFTKSITKWGSHKNSTPMLPPSELSAYPTQRNGALRRLSSAKYHKQEKTLITTPAKHVMRSGPLDRRVQEKMMMTDKCFSISGPLDGKLFQEKYSNWSPIRGGLTDGKWRERSTYGRRSPSICGTWEGKSLSPMLNHYYGENVRVEDGGHSLWSLMFQDMKPT